MPSVPVRITGMLTVLESDARPEHPIVIPEPPLGIWGPTDPRPTPPIFIPPGALEPGVPAHPIWIPVYPAHPIVIPPDAVAPGVPTHPIYLPPGIWGPTDPRPTHPIVIPPDSLGPGKPTHPIYLPPGIWGPPGPWPSPPIYLPIVPPMEQPDNPAPIQPIGGVPGPNGLLVWYPIPGYGWVGVPAGGPIGQPPSGGRRSK